MSSSTTRTRRCCPPVSAPTRNDSRILTCAVNLAAEGSASRWSARTCRCGSRPARSAWPRTNTTPRTSVASGWTGMDEMEVAAEEVDTLFADGEIDLAEARDLPCHTGIRLLGGSSPRWAGSPPDKRVRLVRGDREAFGLRGRSR